MTPIDIGLSESTSEAASNSGATNIDGHTTDASPLMWIVLGVVSLVGFVLFLKLRR